MNRKIEGALRAGATIALIGGTLGMAIKDGPRLVAEIAEKEQAIDNRCGGPTRPNCERIVKRMAMGGFTGQPHVVTFVEFVPKPTPTSTPTELGGEK